MLTVVVVVVVVGGELWMDGLLVVEGEDGLTVVLEGTVEVVCTAVELDTYPEVETVEKVVDATLL